MVSYGDENLRVRPKGPIQSYLSSLSNIYFLLFTATGAVHKARVRPFDVTSTDRRKGLSKF